MVSAYNRLIATYMITKSVEQSDALKQAFQDMLCVPGLAQAGAEQGNGGMEGAPESEVCPAYWQGSTCSACTLDSCLNHAGSLCS